MLFCRSYLTWHDTYHRGEGYGENKIVKANRALAEVFSASLSTRTRVRGQGLDCPSLDCDLKRGMWNPNSLRWWFSVTEGPVACGWGVPLAVSAPGKQLEADSCFSTYSMSGYWVPGNSCFQHQGVKLCCWSTAPAAPFRGAGKWESGLSPALPDLSPCFQLSNFAKLQLYVGQNFSSWA